MSLYGSVSGALAAAGRHADEDVGRALAAMASDGANADLLFRRLLVTDNDELAVAHLRAVARACGQVPATLLQALHGRRAAAAVSLAAHARSAVVTSVVITPQWRLVVGHGETSASETSLTLSPTYGVPIVPGSALKGLSVAQARAENALADEHLRRLFGSPRPSDQAFDAEDERDDARQGSVVLFDALPVDPPQVVVDTLTPHVKPYYDEGNKTEEPASPPAEYHNPVPVRFLALGRTPMRALLAGPAEDVALAAGLLCRGLDDRGIGGKTAAGYGYCDTQIENLHDSITDTNIVTKTNPAALTGVSDPARGGS